MKILILGSYSSPHIQKWSKALADQGFHICIVTFPEIEENYYSGFDNISLYSLGVLPLNRLHKSQSGQLYKIRYLSGVFKLRKKIREFKPDIVHSHYATGYGLIGAVSGYRPFIVSVWGEDVFTFPKISFIHRMLFKFVMLRADKILSTSRIMADEIKKYSNKEVTVTPFGIDLNKFKPYKVNKPFDDSSIIIGTIKNLAPKYGIDTLIYAFSILVKRRPDLPLKLMIVGGGEWESRLKELAGSLGLNKDVLFTGIVHYEDIVVYHNMIDIYAALSNDDSESFGVAIIEASAVEKPVVVSRVGGLKEVVADRETGYVIEPRNPEEAADAIEKLVLDESLRIEMGKKGRKRVADLYDFQNNLKQMIEIYNNSAGSF